MYKLFFNFYKGHTEEKNLKRENLNIQALLKNFDKFSHYMFLKVSQDKNCENDLYFMLLFS